MKPCSLRALTTYCLLLALAGCSASNIEQQTQAATGTEAHALEHVDWQDEQLDIYFVPGGEAVEDRIAAELGRAQHTIRVAMYNLRSERQIAAKCQ